MFTESKWTVTSLIFALDHDSTQHRDAASRAKIAWKTTLILSNVQQLTLIGWSTYPRTKDYNSGEMC